MSKSNLDGLKLQEDKTMSLSLSSTDSLLVQLSNLNLTHRGLNSIRESISQGIDWDDLLEKTRRHRMAGYIHFQALTHRLGLPLGFMGEILKDVVIAKSRSAKIFQEISSISRKFAQIETPVVILKGPVLVHMVYGCSTIRPFKDIDLLTPSESVLHVEDYLGEMGYRHVKFDYMDNHRIHALEKADVNRPRPLSSHRRPMMRQVDSSFIGPRLELHYPGVRLGKVSDETTIEDSQVLNALGPGLRALSSEDLVIQAACHFYRHFRLAQVTAVSTSMGAFITHNAGVMKFLADIFACLKSYLTNGGSWSKLVARSNTINATEVLYYGLYYMDLVYGKGTVPGQIFDALVHRNVLEVPLLNVSPSVRSIKELIKPEIRTASAMVQPELWLFQPDHACGEILRLAKGWRSQRKAWPSLKCWRINECKKTNGVLSEAAWATAQLQSLDEANVDPNQFFLTHVTGGAWCQRKRLYGLLRLLWDENALYVRVSVSANVIHYVSPKFIGHGEYVSLFLSDLEDESRPIDRISCSIGKDGFLGNPEPPEFSSGAWREVGLSRIKADVRTLNKGYRLDLQIPWRILSINANPGVRFGFDVEIVNRSERMTIETALAWSGGEFLSEVDRSVHGVVTLS